MADMVGTIERLDRACEGMGRWLSKVDEGADLIQSKPGVKWPT